MDGSKSAFLLSETVSFVRENRLQDERELVLSVRTSMPIRAKRAEERQITEARLPNSEKIKMWKSSKMD